MSKQTRQKEVRAFATQQPLTVRTVNGSKQVSGYAIVFNSRSSDLGGFTEVCSPTMLDRTMKENPDILAFRDHRQELLIGRTTASTLELRVDSKGLAFTITLPNTAIGDDTAENVRLGNLSGCSFGMAVRDDKWEQGADGTLIRTLLDIDLYEISITSFPAYSATSVNTRSCPIALRSKLSAQLRDDDSDGSDSDDPCEEYESAEDCPVCDEESDQYDEDACSEAETNALRKRLRVIEERVAAEPELETLRLKLRLAQLSAKVI